MMGWVTGLLLAVLATANLYIPDLGGGLLTDPTTIALVLTLALAIRAWRQDRFRVGTSHLVLGIVALSFVPGLVTAAHDSYGRTKVLGLIATFAITWAAMQLLVPHQVRKLFIFGLWMAGAAVSLALILFGESTTYYGRTSIFALNPIGLGRIVALGALLAILAATRVRGVQLGGLLLVALLCAYGAFLTGSRGPIAAAVIAALFAFLPGRIHLGWRAVWAGLAFCAAIGVGFAVLIATGASRLVSLSSSGRADLWRESFLLALRRPGGIGFGDLYGKVSLPAWSTGETAYSHNMLLEAAVEGGWIALAGLSLALVVSFRWLRRDLNNWTGRAMLAVWVYATVNAALSSDLVGNRLMWVMIGAGLALSLRHVPPSQAVSVETNAPATFESELLSDC